MTRPVHDILPLNLLSGFANINKYKHIKLGHEREIKIDKETFSDDILKKPCLLRGLPSSPNIQCSLLLFKVHVCRCFSHIRTLSMYRKVASCRAF